MKQTYINEVVKDPELRIKFLVAMYSWFKYLPQKEDLLPFLCRCAGYSIPNFWEDTQRNMIDNSFLELLIPKPGITWGNHINCAWWPPNDYESRELALTKAIKNLLPPYSSLRVLPCYLMEDGTINSLSETEKPNFWGVYGREEGKEEHWIADFETLDLANQFMDLLLFVNLTK